MFNREREKKIKSPFSPLHFELDKSGKKSKCTVCGVVSVLDLTDTAALLVTHSGKVRINGEKLILSTYTERVVELSGIISGVELIYGKN